MVRVSGVAVPEVFGALCRKVPQPRVATLMAIRDSAGALVDKGICLYLPGPGSFTGEDVGEFQVHGGRAVVAALLAALGELPGLRPAEAGEFTRRAFVSGKLDLVEVEALSDLIDAQTQGQLRLAQRLAAGDLSARVARWRRELVAAMARLEALLDFSDEGDVAERAEHGVADRLAPVLHEIAAVLDDKGRGERLRDGVTIVIAGPPNAGKSTLLNLLARRDAAIVSAIAGTTRDPIEVHLELGGVPVTIVDTAGLRDGGDVVEAMGVARARDRLARADLVLWLEPVGEPVGEAVPAGGRILRIGTKADVPNAGGPQDVLRISAATGAGIAELLDEVERHVVELAGADESVLISRARQRIALADCAGELRRCLEEEDGGEVELQAERLRLAVRALERLTGRVDVEEVLGEIFAGFCIGK